MTAEPTPHVPEKHLEIRPLHPDHLSATAVLHAHQLPNGLFPALDPRFLRSWHRTFIDSDHAAAVVVVDTSAHDTVVGYLLLALDPPAHVHELKVKHRRRLLREGVLGLVRRPGVGVYFARTRAVRYAVRLLARRPRRAETAGERVPAVVHAVVHAVVTHPGYARRGIATRLLHWAQLRAVDAGLDQLALVTDAGKTSKGVVLAPAEFQGAATMYDHLGWRRVAQHERDGRTLVEFRKDLAEGSAAHD